MKNIYFLIILTVAIACNKSESVDSKKITALAKVHRYDLDTNHFKVIKNKWRDELIYVNEFGQKEISFEYDDKGLFDVNYFLYGKQVQRKTHFTKSDSLEVIYSIIQPAGHEFYFDRIYFDKTNGNILNQQSPYITHTVDTVQLQDKTQARIKTPEREAKTMCHLVLGQLDDYFRVLDPQSITVINVSNDAYAELEVNTLQAGNHSIKGMFVVTRVEADKKVQITYPMRYDYYVKPEKVVTMFDKEFMDLINEKINSGT